MISTTQSTVAEDRVLGAGLPVQDLSSDGLSMLVTSRYGCDDPVPIVLPDEREG